MAIEPERGGSTDAIAAVTLSAPSAGDESDQPDSASDGYRVRRPRRPDGGGRLHLLPSRSGAVTWVALSLPMLVWLAALWPAVMTNDSIDMLGQWTTGRIVNWHPPVLTFLLGLSWSSVGSPVLLAFFQVLAMSWVIRRILDVAVGAGARPLATYGFGVVVCALPSVGAFTVHIWKDVPFTVGFLLVLEWVLILALARLRKPRSMPGTAASVRLFLGLLLVLLMRPNGTVLVAVLSLALVPLLLGSGWRRPAVALGGALVGFAMVVVLVYPAVGVRPPPEQNSAGLALFDLAALAQHDASALEPAVRAELEKLAPIEAFRRGHNCHWTVTGDFRSSVAPTPQTDYALLAAGWRDALLSRPFLLAGNHFCAASEVWNPWPSAEEQQAYEALYFGVIPNDLGVSSDPLSDRLGARLKDLIQRSEDGGILQTLLWRSATWVWLVTVLFGLAAFRRRSWWCAVPLLPLLAHGVSVVAIYGPHYRYGAPSWIGAMVMMPTAVLLILRAPSGMAKTSAEGPAPDSDRLPSTG